MNSSILHDKDRIYMIIITTHFYPSEKTDLRRIVFPEEAISVCWKRFAEKVSTLTIFHQILPSKISHTLSHFSYSAKETLSEKVSQAQELAKGTVEELFGDKSNGNNTDNKNNNDDTQQSPSSNASSSSSSQQQQDKKTSENTSSQPPFTSRLADVASSILNEMKAALLPEAPTASALRGAAAKVGDIQTSSVTDVAVAPPQEESAWSKQWRDMSEKLSGHPFFKSMAGLRNSKVVTAGKDVADAVRERWETSDSPFVHRIQDATDAFFAETEAASALRLIRTRDPTFDMVRFLKLVKADVPVLIQAYLTGDEKVIKEHCSPEMIERLVGISKAQAAAGLVPDATLLDTSEVELVDLKMVDESPVVVAQFTCQQINCTRDSHGNVVEGAPDEVHRVYYYWALQQEDTGFVGADGKHHPPRWQLREMLIRGMHHLL